jgi:hypothetical protein
MGKTLTINPRHGAHRRRSNMLRKLTLGLIAATSLSALALAPTAASAGGGGGWHGGFGGGFGGMHHHHFGHGFGIGYIGAGYVDDDGCYVVRRVPTPFGYRLRTVNICAY